MQNLKRWKRLVLIYLTGSGYNGKIEINKET